FRLRRAREHDHQVGSVDDDDEQDEGDAALQEMEGAAELANEERLHRQDDRMETRVDENLLELWEAIEIACVERVDLLPRLHDGCRWFEAGDVRPVVAVARLI